MVFSALPTLLAGFILNGNGQQIAVAYTIAALVASIAYSALFLLLGTVSRHAVVFGLVYALVWEALFGSLVPGARTLSVQQWSLAVAEKVAGEGADHLGRRPAARRPSCWPASTVGGHLVRGPEAAGADARRRGVSTGGPGRTPARPLPFGRGLFRADGGELVRVTWIFRLVVRVRGGNWNPGVELS